MGELAAALATLQTKLPHILKDSAAIIQSKEGGRAYGYKYADLATISKAVLPLLGDLGLSFWCAPTVRDDGKFVLAYALMHSSDPVALEGAYPLPTGSPQQIGSAITYARRYCLCAVTGAVADEDDDGQEAERADGLPTNADGSLSRSRTTDDQKNAAGVMTSAQQAEHNALRRQGEPAAGRVEKLGTTPVDDPFYEPRPEPVRAKPAGWLLSERFKALGVMDRNERLLQCGEIIGRPISSSTELEPGEFAAILEALQQRELAT